MVVRDRDYSKDRVSVPGERRKVHRPGKTVGTVWRRLALSAFLGLGVFWLLPDHGGLDRLAYRITALPAALTGAPASIEPKQGGLSRDEVHDKISPLVEKLSDKKKPIYDRIVGFGTDLKLSLSIDEAVRRLEDAMAEFRQGALSRADRTGGSLPGRSGAVRQDLPVKGAALGIMLLVCFGLGSGFQAVLGRSVRQLDESIRKLGMGELGKPIRVAGPRKLRYLGNRLDWLRTRLLGREQSTRQFMHNISDEFETRLSGISRNTGELMSEAAEALSPRQRDLVARLGRDVRKLQNLLDESLRYDRVKDHPSPQPKAAMDMKALVASVIDAHQGSLKAKSLVIKDLVQPVEFRGVPDQVRTIVDKLIANAIEFSPNGGTIRIILRASGTGMELEIEDDGPGIDPAERPRIFEPFFRGEAARMIGAEGAGLGLAIVSECVANHRGKVESIEPRQDQQGARIRVELPLAEALS